MKSKPCIGITLGDVAGIGPEVIAKALQSGKLDGRFEYRVLFGNLAPAIAPGRVSRRAAHFALECLERGVALALQGSLAALVTGPVNKSGLKMTGFSFPGQTEFLAHLTRTKKFAMMLVGGKLRVSLVTTHVPLREVPSRLTQAGIADTILLTSHYCRQAGIQKPRIAVAGLNPHAGEIGTEEKSLILPALQKARRRLRSLPSVLSGPHSPDTVFYQALQGAYDAVVCMYHDQGLIPLKMLSFDTGVNVTLGLPIIRTSPDHGTAYDIAGKNRANPESMIAALNLAAQLAGSKPHN
ncbi:MAG: 4-hydroxythreonine-4-phosphate dehydrogenase PdxA [Verrucomicrobiae bacterium]|nr:4-hydroxythreonine-4-phosphate dehydrogenase PdxA [Verrucomicrobiae bacterium]